MLNITNELKAKLLAAKSADEVTELVKADGQKITAEESTHLWEEISRKREQDGKTLSQEELEAVSGGRDWSQEGCAATVEEGSRCWGTDACSGIVIGYSNFDASKKCPNYPGPHQFNFSTCKYCGCYDDRPVTCYMTFQ